MQYTYSNTTQHPGNPYSKPAASTYITTGATPDEEGYIGAVKVHTGHSDCAKGLVVTAYAVRHKPGSEQTLLFGNGNTTLYTQAAARITPKLVAEVHAATLAKWEPAQIVQAVADKLAKGA